MNPKLTMIYCIQIGNVIVFALQVTVVKKYDIKTICN